MSLYNWGPVPTLNHHKLMQQYCNTEASIPQYSATPTCENAAILRCCRPFELLNPCTQQIWRCNKIPDSVFTNDQCTQIITRRPIIFSSCERKPLTPRWAYQSVCRLGRTRAQLNDKLACAGISITDLCRFECSTHSPCSTIEPIWDPKHETTPARPEDWQYWITGCRFVRILK